MKFERIFCLFVLLASTGLEICYGSQEQYQEYNIKHGRKKSVGIVNRQSDESDTAFLPTYTQGSGIRFFCVTKSKDFKPCLSKDETPPELSVPEEIAVSFYVWESETKAAKGFYVSSHRGKILKYENEFENFKEMERLYLVDQGIHELGFAFNKMKDLVELDLHSNALKRLRQTNFQGLESLQTLNVGGNKIASIDDDAFAQLESFTEIDLSENEITSLGWKLFGSMRNLTILILNDNKIGEISGFSTLRSEEIDGSSSLKILSEGMSESAQYSPFRDSAFKLSRLDLQNNLLTTLEDLLPRIPNVEYLDVSNNRLETIGRKSLLSLRKLKVLNIRKNQLKVSYPEWFYALVANTKEGQSTQVSIADNEWKCTCEILAFAEYREKKLTSKILQELSKSMQVYCFTPEFMKDRLLSEVVETIRTEYECPVPHNDDVTNGQPSSGPNTKQETIITSPGGGLNIHMSPAVAITLIFGVFIAYLLNLYISKYRAPQAANVVEHRGLGSTAPHAGDAGNIPTDNDDAANESEARPAHATPSTKNKIKKSVSSSDPNTKPKQEADDTADQQGQEHLDGANNAAPASNLVRNPLRENPQQVESENLRNEALDPGNQPVQNQGNGDATSRV